MGSVSSDSLRMGGRGRIWGDKRPIAARFLEDVIAGLIQCTSWGGARNCCAMLRDGTASGGGAVTVTVVAAAASAVTG